MFNKQSIVAVAITIILGIFISIVIQPYITKGVQYLTNNGGLSHKSINFLGDINNYRFYNFKFHGSLEQTVTLPGVIVPGQDYHLRMVYGRDKIDNHCSEEIHNEINETICDPDILQNDANILYIQVGDQAPLGEGFYNWQILDQNYNPVFAWTGNVDYSIDLSPKTRPAPS